MDFRPWCAEQHSECAIAIGLTTWSSSSRLYSLYELGELAQLKLVKRKGLSFLRDWRAQALKIAPVPSSHSGLAMQRSRKEDGCSRDQAHHVIGPHRPEGKNRGILPSAKCQLETSVWLWSNEQQQPKSLYYLWARNSVLLTAR